MLEKVISGGQTGADQAGLRAARSCGIATGGWLPKGCITQDGPNPNLINEFGMQEHKSDGYPPRTEANVRDSDGTIRLATNLKSRGEACTLSAIKWYKKPRFDVDMKKPRPISEVVDWILKENVKVLNVAGNAESTAPGIGVAVEKYLEQVFVACREIKQQSEGSQ